VKRFMPFDGQIIVKRDAYKYKSVSGIVIPEMHKSLPTVGTVVDIGAGVTKVFVGDRVFFTQLSGIRVSYQDRSNPWAGEDGFVELLIMKEVEIVCLLMEVEYKEEEKGAYLYED